MPRITYHDRFASLLAKDYVSDRDRRFAESLYGHYKRKGSLTSGRRRCFIQMEERYATRPEPAAGIENLTPILSRLADIDPGSWDEQFVMSVKTQLLGGRQLSDRQTDILHKIEAKYSDDEMAKRQTWATDWDDEKAENYRIALSYYRQTGYFNRQVNTASQDPDFVPTREEYRKVTENKFARKVLAGWHAEPKFAAGSMVALAAGAHWTETQKCPNRHKLCMVVATNAASPTSAARGCKIYKVLPVGGSQTFLIEERHLKRGRVPKMK